MFSKNYDNTLWLLAMEASWKEILLIGLLVAISQRDSPQQQLVSHRLTPRGTGKITKGKLLVTMTRRGTVALTTISLATSAEIRTA